MANVARYLTGFEGWPTGIPPTGLVSGATGSPAVGTAYARPESNGTQGFQAKPNPSQDESIDTVIVTGGQAVAAASIWHKAVTIDTSQGDYGLFAISANSGGYMYVGIDTNGKYAIYDSAAVKHTPVGPTVVTGQWDLIELLVDMHTNPWTVKWRINGADQTDPNSFAATASTFRRCGMGAFSAGSRTCEHWFDDLLVIDGTDQTMWAPGIGGADIMAFTADQGAAAAHQSIVTTEWQYTDDFSDFTHNFASATETDSRSRLDDLNTSDGIRMSGATTLTQPVFRAAGAKSAGTTSAVTVSAPTGIATGDLEILIAETTTTCSISNNGGGAWTAMTNSPVAAPTGGRALYIWWRIRGASDGNPTVTAATDQICACRICYQTGTFDTNDPFELETANTEHTVPEDTSFSTGALGSTSGNSRVVGCVATILRDSNTGGVPQMTNANLTSLSNHSVDYCTNSGNGGGFGFTDGVLATAGAAGTFANTYAVASGKAWLAFAIKPASAAGGAITGNARWPVATPSGEPTADPVAVSVITVGRMAAAGTSNLTARTELGGSVTNHINGSITWGTTWTYLNTIMATKPGGGAWANADIDSINFELDSTDCDPAVWISGFVYEVAYPISTTPINADIAASYNIIAQKNRDIAGSYNLQNIVNHDSAAAYAIRGKVNHDIAGTYNVIAHAQHDIAGSYNIIAHVNRDLAATYDIQALVIAMDLLFDNFDDNSLGSSWVKTETPIGSLVELNQRIEVVTTLWGFSLSPPNGDWGQLNDATSQAQLDKAMALGMNCPRITGHTFAAQNCRDLGLRRWITILGSGKNFPDSASVIAYCEDWPEAIIAPGNELNIGATTTWTAAALAAAQLQLRQDMIDAGVPNLLLLSSVGNSASQVEGLLPLAWCQALAAAGCVYPDAFDIADYHMYSNDPQGYDNWMHVWTPSGGNSCQSVFGNPPYIISEFGCNFATCAGSNQTNQANAVTDWMDKLKSLENCIGGAWYTILDHTDAGTGWGLEDGSGNHRLSWDAYYAEATT